MKGATHISPCGRWHYKVYPNPGYMGDYCFNTRKLTVEFWDVHCNKWRPSMLTVKSKYMVKIDD